MVELFLDGKAAVLKDNVSIKLTRENVYFTKTGSYTYDIELPLNIKQNREIFGSINRRDVEASYGELHAVLRADNITLLDGTAAINQITEDDVKIQLLGGNSEMNFYTKGANLYVDELDLGDWQKEMLDWSLTEQATQKGTAYYQAYFDWTEVTSIMCFNTPDNTDSSIAETAFSWWAPRWWQYDESAGYDDKNNRGMAFPVINTNSSWNSNCDQGLLCNEFVMRQHGDKFYPEYRVNWDNAEQLGTNTPQVCASYQPMLCRTLRKVLKAVGYELDINGLKQLYATNELFPRIFIVTANNRNEIAKALPHWTVNDFLTQVEQFLGIVIDIDETTKTSSIVSRYDWYNGDATVISEVVDEFTAEIDEDETSDISVGNVGFADMEDSEFHLSSDILDIANWEYDKFKSINEMQAWLKAGPSVEDKGTIFVVGSRRFILASDKDDDGNVTEYYLKEVDQFGALYRNTDSLDIDVELKIVPAQVTKQTIPFVKENAVYNINKTYYNCTKLGEAEVDVMIIEGPSEVSTTDPELNTSAVNADIEALISGEQDVEESSEVDKMYVAYVPKSMGTITTGSYSGSYPIIVPCSQTEVRKTSVIQKSPSDGYLQLDKLSDAETLGSTALNDETVIDTTVQYCFKFISKEVLKPTGLFLINNQKFACQKLEYQISSNGVNPLVTGYFYRIKS